MAFNYNKLRGKIREVFSTQEDFAKAISISTVSLSYKLNNKSEWSQQEINRAAETLNIADEEIVLYFFTQKV